MSALGPWRPAAALTAEEGNALIQSRLPESAKIIGTSSADAKNAVAISRDRAAPYLPNSNIVQIETTQVEQFVRVYGGDSGQPGTWIMRAEDVAGLTPEQIASKFSLPQVPTKIADVTLPPGTTLEVSVASAVSPKALEGIVTGDNGGGGGVQIQIQSRPANLGEFSSWFSNERPIQ
jgi:filamentous hemagglutinin